jgi:hypothetical protein
LWFFNTQSRPQSPRAPATWEAGTIGALEVRSSIPNSATQINLVLKEKQKASSISPCGALSYVNKTN